MSDDVSVFAERQEEEEFREKDWRSQYSRDNARIIHSAGFRRLQGKTQVMGPGEGDFHRTRLTHSLEVTQIGLGLVDGLIKRDKIPENLQPYVQEKDSYPDTRDGGYRHVIAAACEAHDLGHPPFGHNGERALHAEMCKCGGFEGNAQTIRLLVKLEKYKKHKGVNPTRRFLLAVMKYPVAFSQYPNEVQTAFKPPKCYYDEHQQQINWALAPFAETDRLEFVRLAHKGGKLRPQHKSFDASIMDCADDIAYATHDLEDVVARELINKYQLLQEVESFYNKNPEIENYWKQEYFEKLYGDSYTRKGLIGKLVNLLMTHTNIVQNESFEHPLLKYNLIVDKNLTNFVEFLKTDLTYKLVINWPKVQMLEIKGRRIISALYNEYILSPEKLIPHWGDLDAEDTAKRRVCDYIAGMTDSFAVKMYHRLFTPGVGSSSDEL